MFYFKTFFALSEIICSPVLEKTRMKTSIRYAKENDKEKREREKGRRKDIEREGERRREREG